MQRAQAKTYLKVFIEILEEKDTNFGSNSDNNIISNNSVSSPNTPSYLKKNKYSFGNIDDSGFYSSNNSNLSRKQTTTAEYTIVPITNTSSAGDVCNAVARKRNIQYSKNEYELVMCDGDGKASYETVLKNNDIPWSFQQSAARHGHLGDFHFVFRKILNGYDDSDNDNSISGDDSDQDIFSVKKNINNNINNNSNNKPPTILTRWMEKRGKTNKAFRKRWFVLDNDELLYFRRKEQWENGKAPIAKIQLNDPPAIIKVHGIRYNNYNNINDRKDDIISAGLNNNDNIGNLYYYFDIHTPKRIYSLRIDDYNDMCKWIKHLQRKDESNLCLDALNDLIENSELMHGNDDEIIMDKFSTLENILSDKLGINTYLKYLQSQHNEDFALFWIDLQKYLSDFHTSTKTTQQRFANELYNKYIKSGAKNQLSEIKSKQRNIIKKKLNDNIIEREMFSDIQTTVFNVLNRDAYDFFNSKEYFRFIITYTNNNSNNNKLFTDKKKFLFPKNFNDNIMKNNQNLTKIYIPNSIKPQKSPLMHTPPNINNDINNNILYLNTKTKRKKNPYGGSIFDNAPGLKSNFK